MPIRKLNADGIAVLNDVPIDDEWTVLDLLYRRWGDRTTRKISRWFEWPYLEIGHHHDFSDSSYQRFRVTDRVVDALLDIGHLQGTPEWGYTNMRELTISDGGGHVLWERRKEMEIATDLRADWWMDSRYA